MMTWIKRDFAVGAALGLALVGASACDALEETRGAGGKGTTSTSTSTGTNTGAGGDHVACTALAIAEGARFTPTSGPDGATFKAISATPHVVFATTGKGLHRSKDGGDTWSLVGAAEVRGKNIQAIAALGDLVFVSDETSVHTSHDGGETWTDVSSGEGVAPTYFSVHGESLYAIHGGKPFTWSAATGTWEALPSPDEFFDVIESDGTSLYANSLYAPGVFRLRLDDPQALWVKVNGLPEWGYRAFAFLPGHAFASNDAHVFHSVDDGVSWKALPSGFDANDLLVVGNTLYAASTKGIEVSADAGATWTHVSASPAMSAFSLASDGQRVFAASDGIQRQAGAGGAWSRLHVLADSIGILFPTEASVFSFSTNGIHRTTDRGATWSDTQAVGGGIYYWGTPFVRRGDDVFGLGVSKSLLTSKDDGASFAESALPAMIAKGQPTLIASTARDLVIGTMSAAGAGCSDAQDLTMTFYRSSDGGATWSSGENNLPVTFTDCYGVSYRPAVTALSQHGQSLFATSWHDGAFRSSDDGATWQSMGKLRGFVSVGESVFAAASKGVVKSVDGGATWAASGLEGFEVITFAVADELLFASVGSAESAFGAIHVSRDAGATWARVDAQFDVPVDALAVLGNRLFAGTRDQSVWSLDLACAP